MDHGVIFGGRINTRNMVIEFPDYGENLNIWCQVQITKEGCKGIYYAPISTYINGDQGL